jgi:hypothetical protein
MSTVTVGGVPAESPEQVVARLGISIEAAREHVGDHRCVDGRRYVGSCLVTDPACHDVAVSNLTRQAWKAGGAEPHDYQPVVRPVTGTRACGRCGMRGHPTLDPRRERPY